MEIAVIKTGGKQYVVSPGTRITIEIMRDKTFKEGDAISFSEVLLKDNGALSFGLPTIAGATVEGKVYEVGKARKVEVIRYKAKSNYHKRKGHRQPEMKVEITKI